MHSTCVTRSRGSIKASTSPMPIRALAFANIEKAAKHNKVDLSETSSHDPGVHPPRNRKEAAAKGAVTRERESLLRESEEQG